MAITRMGTGTANLGGTGNLLNNAYIEKVFVSSLYKNLLAAPLGRPSTMPEQSGSKVVRWQYFSVPTANTTALTEGGDPPNSTDYTTTPKEATLAEYGGVTEESKFLMKTAVSGTDEEFAKGLGYQAALTIDTLVLDGTAGFASSTTSVDSGVAVTADYVRRAAATLGAVDAKFHRTTGGRFYAGIFTSNAAYDLAGEGAPSWFQAKSSDYFAALTSPFSDSPQSAALYDVLIRKSNNIPTGGGDDLNVVIADDSLGIASLDTDIMQPRLIRTPPDMLVSAPLRNRGTVGWWILFSRILFDSNRVCVLKADT